MTAAARRWAELRLAFAMLTRLPVGRIDPCPPVGAAAWAFPVAGVLPGLALGMSLWAGVAIGLPPLGAALLGLAAGALATGGLHEDGLADFVDGLSGGRTRERRLEIMRDSRVGSHGALALILATGLRGAAVMAAADGPARTAIAVPLAAAVLSRAVMPVLMRILPPARPEGLGAGAARGLDRRRAWAAVLIGAGSALALVGAPAALAAVLAAALAAAAVGSLAWLRLRGQTGDVLGAAQVVAETAALLALVATLPKP